MATPKMSTRRPKSVLDQDRYTAELSTGQLVIGVCILLMFGLGCFLLGVLIGKFDPTLKPSASGSIASSADDATTPEVKVAEVTVAPVPVSTEPSSTETSLPPEMRVPPRMLNDTTAATQDSTPPAVTATSTLDPNVTPPAPTAVPSESSVAGAVEAEIEKNRVAPPNAAPQAVDTSAAPPPAAVTTEPPAEKTKPAEPETAWKGYGVQIVAVAKDRAETARKALESKSSYKARVLPHTKNNLYRVVVGPYSDQAAAVRARDDLRARHGYKDAFVLTLQ